MIKNKPFDTVSFFRKEKERIAKETEEMDIDQLKAYITKKSEWANNR